MARAWPAIASSDRLTRARPGPKSPRRFERSADGGANWTQVTTQPSTRFTASSIAEGSYVFRVRAFDNVGNLGSWSASSIPVLVDLTAPNAPGVPVAVPNPSNGSATVTWAAATDSGGSGLEGYRVQGSFDAGAT